jgi:hypothetical protein
VNGLPPDNPFARRLAAGFGADERSAAERRMLRLPMDRRLAALLESVARAEGIEIGALVERIVSASLEQPPGEPYRDTTRRRLAALKAEFGWPPDDGAE